MKTEYILRELNPRYDLARHNKGSSFTEDIKNQGWLALNMVKSMLRGTVVGAVITTPIGIVSSALAGEDITQGAKYGIHYGLLFGAFDMCQYLLRFFDHTMINRFKFSLAKRVASWTVVGGLATLAMYSEVTYTERLKMVEDSFVKEADTSLDGKIEGAEMEAVNKQLQNYYAPSNFTPFKKSSELTYRHRADYLRSIGHPDGDLIYIPKKKK